MPRRLALDMAASLAALAGVEAEIERLVRNPAPRTFYRYRRVCLSCPFLARMASPGRMRRAWRLARAVAPFDPLTLPFRTIYAERGAAPVAADIVVIKAGIRAFYADLGITVKTANPLLPGGNDRLRREADLRHRLEGTEVIGVPALIETGTAGAVAYLVEAVMEGDHHERRIEDPGDFAEHLLAFYLANGAAPRALAEVMDLEAEWRRFAAGARTFGYAVPDGLEAALPRLRGGGPILWGLCHGDLSAENMIAEAGGRVILIDWEHARDDPIFADVAKLAVREPVFRDAFVRAVRAWDGTGAVLDPMLQLALGGLVAVNRRADWIGGVASERDLALRSFRRKAGHLVRVIEGALREAAPPQSRSAR